MKLLLDTHLLIWVADYKPSASTRLSHTALALIRDPANVLHFSVASIWEVAIKSARGRETFTYDPYTLRQGLLDAGYIELPVTGAHAAAVSRLPPLHKDPFDRMLVAQAAGEGLLLLTADARLDGYPAPIRRM